MGTTRGESSKQTSLFHLLLFEALSNPISGGLSSVMADRLSKRKICGYFVPVTRNLQLDFFGLFFLLC